MSLYGPTVENTPFTGLGDAISGGLDRFLQARQLQYQKDLTAYQTGYGIKWPQPETPTASPPVSIMATAAPTGPASQPSGPLPGVGGLPSPGRVQDMAPPSGDLGDALRTGQQGVLGGAGGASAPAGQPHDDLRAAFSAVGRGPMGAGMMALPGQSYTPSPTQSSGFDPNQMVTLPSGQQVPIGQTSFGRQMQQMQIANYLKTVEAKKDLAQADEFSAGAYKARREGGQLLPGDAGYVPFKGQLAGAEAGATAAAKLPYDIEEAIAKGEIDKKTGEALALVRGNIEAGLQSNQQTFTAKQNDLNRKATATNQATAQTATQATKLAGINAEAGNSLATTIGRKLHILSTPRTPQQIDWDQKAADYKAANPNDSDADTFIAQHLGARPENP